MNQGTKQRVVGTVVLLALALIFLPLVLDGDGNYQPTVSSRIPEAPVVEFMPEPVAERPVIDADSFPREPEQPVTDIPLDAPAESEVAARALPEQESPATVVIEESPTADVEPALDVRSLPEGWSVRLGVFSNAVNAQNLTSRLLDAGYRAYNREIPGAQGMVTGVFVGPLVERVEANRLKDQLQSEFQLSGLVVRFEVDPIR